MFAWRRAGRSSRGSQGRIQHLFWTTIYSKKYFQAVVQNLGGSVQNAFDEPRRLIWAPLNPILGPLNRAIPFEIRTILYCHFDPPAKHSRQKEEQRTVKPTLSCHPELFS